ncbi:hypothetical protein [Lactiplantibacillus plantarum]|uniref:hypothetical protein n=1 Tax=Lactiplantibacillus plantarum TaxID=1590 RepID=UPI00280B30DA|nr:hypothetical protein [Lactiplantibacillus plantarum]
MDSNKITKKLQINFNDGTWTDCPLNLKIIFPDRTMSMSLSDEDNLKRLGSCIIHNQNIPLSLLILQHSKAIIDLRIRYVSLAMAAEIGVKEAFRVLVQIFLADLILVYWVPRNEGLRA